jgi:alcohol-forming fatty acyl-CoA reductase
MYAEFKGIEAIGNYRNENSIEGSYAGTGILITGASDFVGKALLEKLLRVCPGVTSVFLSLRAKRNQTVEERFEKLLDGPVHK